MEFFVILCTFVSATAAPLNAFAGDPSVDLELSDYPQSFSPPKYISIPATDNYTPASNRSSGLAESVYTSIEDVRDVVSNAATRTYGYVEPVYQTVKTEAYNITNNVATKASNAVKRIGSNVQDAAFKTKSFVIQTSHEAAGFFSTSFQSLRTWFSNLEQDIKDVLHFTMRVIEVVATVAILLVFVWILRRVTSGYRFLKSVTHAFEMEDRPTTV